MLDAATEETCNYKEENSCHSHATLVTSSGEQLYDPAIYTPLGHGVAYRYIRTCGRPGAAPAGYMYLYVIILVYIAYICRRALGSV